MNDRATEKKSGRTFEGQDTILSSFLAGQASKTTTENFVTSIVENKDEAGWQTCAVVKLW